MRGGVAWALLTSQVSETRYPCWMLFLEVQEHGSFQQAKFSLGTPVMGMMVF